MLPFLNLSGDPEQAYFVEGITDQIVTDLARFKALFVLSTESTAKYQEQSADPQKLRRELGVNYLLDGSVRRERDEIRLSTRLVDAESGKIIWSESYRDELIPSNVFEIQEEVSEAGVGDRCQQLRSDRGSGSGRSATPPAKVICLV